MRFFISIYTLNPIQTLDITLTNWLNDTFGRETGLSFPPGVNSLSISAAPNSNPEGFGTVGSISWKLLQYSYQVRGTLTYTIYTVTQEGSSIVVTIVTATAVCRYEMQYYVWLWRDSETLAFPAQTCPPKRQTTVPKVVQSLAHHGGGGS